MLARWQIFRMIQRSRWKKMKDEESILLISFGFTLQSAACWWFVLFLFFVGSSTAKPLDKPRLLNCFRKTYMLPKHLINMLRLIDLTWVCGHLVGVQKNTKFRTASQPSALWPQLCVLSRFLTFEQLKEEDSPAACQQEETILPADWCR